MLFLSVKNTLQEVVTLVQQLNEEEYIRPCHSLGGATIGQHTRHIIEMFQCLISNYDSACVNYDLRSRNKKIETSPTYAMVCLIEVMTTVGKENKSFQLLQRVEGKDILMETSYYRELLYNLEHCIHHQALIKVAIIDLENIMVSESFGVAPSTIQYKKSCAQ
jgi:hypothetical protein